MKKILPLLAMVAILLGGVFSAHPAEAAGEFITTWKTDNFGTSNSTSVIISTHLGDTYNYDVDWNNDGTFDELGITGDVTHDFGVAGTYTIRIRGVFPRIYFNFDGDAPKIISVDQWGTIAWTSMESAFGGCTNLVINASDAPDLSGVTDMTSAFSDSGPLGSSINTWDVSTITNMAGLFYGNTVFNQSLSNWDTHNVIDMSDMFHGASSFNSPIGSWDVSNVTDMSSMFSHASAFNKNINSWNTSQVTDMVGMFEDATAFNQNIGRWNTSSLTRAYTMFYDAESFNQNIGNWDITNITDLSEIFTGSLSTSIYDLILAGWSKQNVSPDVYFSVEDTKYCNTKAHDILVNTHSWTIDDGGPLLTGCPRPAPKVVGSVSSAHPQSAPDPKPEPDATLTEPKDLLDSGLCPANLIIDDFMKNGDKDGNYSAYNKKKTSEVNILQAHINRILAAKYAQASGPVDGIFGALTKQGVQRLQIVLRDDLHLDLGPTGTDGVVGPFTREAINHSCGGM